MMMNGVQAQLGQQMIQNASNQVAANAETDMYKKPAGLTNQQSNVLSQIANQLNAASQMHKGQANRIRDLGTTVYIEKYDEVLNKVVPEPVVSWGTDATWKGERNATAATVTTILMSGVGVGGIAYGINQIAKGDGLMKGVGAASAMAGALAIFSVFPRAINANQVNPWA